MAWARHGRGMANVNHTRPQCLNQMGKTHSKPLAARHGRETVWLRHATCESVLREPGFLPLNRISELVWDRESYEAGAPSDNRFDDARGFKDEPGVSHLQPDRPKSRGQASSSASYLNASDEEEIIQNGPVQQVQTLSTSQWTRPSGPQRSVVHAFREGPRGQKGN
jgi:hypothetical protein